MYTEDVKKLLISSTILVGLATATSFALTSPIDLGAESDLPIKVQHQQEQLDNHEARITNTEADVVDLQNNTGTPPSSTRVSVPSVSPTPTPTPTPAPPTVTVVAFEQLPVIGTENIDCKLTYSDGTDYTWRWTTVTYNQGVKITNFNGKCDASVTGKPKA